MCKLRWLASVSNSVLLAAEICGNIFICDLMLHYLWIIINSFYLNNITLIADL